MRFILLLAVSLCFSTIVLASPTPNTQLCYQSKIDLPLISNSQEGFTQLMNRTLVNAQMKYTHLLSGLAMPESACNKENYFFTSYQVFSAPSAYVSLRLEIESSFFMNAHPDTYYESLNYDVVNKRELTFDDLFIDKAQALNLLSNYTQNALGKTLMTGKNKQEAVVMQKMIEQGTALDSQNFSHWNLLNKAILITFEPAQVAPRFYGIQEITVPFSVLKPVLTKAFKVAETSESK